MEKNDGKTPAVPTNVMNDLLLGKTQELVSSSEGERNWPGVLIALVVILVVLSLILVSTLLLSPGDRLPRITKPKVQLHPLPLSKNTPQWTSRNEVVYRNELGGISIFNPELNETRELIDNSTFRQLDAEDFLLSSDYEYIIFVTNYKKIYKNTYQAVYYLYEIGAKTRWMIAPVEDDFHTRLYFLDRLEFSPVGHSFVFAADRNLYLSRDGAKAKLINEISDETFVVHGHPDWLYQNEILKDSKAFWFSPDGRYLAYAVFDDRKVGKVVFTRFTSEQYPPVEEISYPKPGTTNPDVSVKVVDLNDMVTYDTEKPKIFKGEAPYLYEIHWNSVSELALIWLNRRQNLTVYNLCTAPNFTCDTKNTMGKLNKGTYEIRKFLDLSTSYPEFFRSRFFDGKYFEAFPDSKPTQRHLFEMADEPICLTCPTKYGNLTTDVAIIGNMTDFDNHPIRSTDCLYTKSKFSSDFKYYLLTCLGPDVPSVHVMDVMYSHKIKTVKTDSRVREIYYSYTLPQIKIFQVKLDDDRLAQVKLSLPPGLREYEETTFPMLLKISAGPSVNHKWSYNYETYLSATKNYILAEIDTGDDTSKISPSAAYDQISVVRYLASNLNFVDKKNVGVYGTGYGGYLAALILALDSDDFKCGVSISGIFSWPHYNSFWTEGYLGTANVTDNYRGYEEADLLRKVGNLRNKKFLIIDSAYDIEVHYQHAMLIIRSLVKADIIFNHMTYPDKPEESLHSKHFQSLTDQFWDECFGHRDYTEWETGMSYFSMKS